MKNTKDIDQIKNIAEKVDDIGTSVYRLPLGEKEYKHAYHIFCPWSPDGKKLLFSSYDRENPEMEICLLDLSSGASSVIGKTTIWESHTAAFQQWLGCQDRVMFRSGPKANSEFTVVNSGGGETQKFKVDEFTLWYASLDGKYVYGTTPFEMVSENDKILPRHDKGILRYDLETGNKKLVFSLEDALALLPNGERYKDCHLYAKMLILHPKSGRIVFNLTNTFWDRDGTEPRVRCLVTVNEDGSNPAYLGNVVHHPNWHTRENKVIGNVKDCNDALRFGLYNGDGSGLLEYVPRSEGAGHPTLSPDGKWICTDSKGGEGYDNSITLYHPVTGEQIFAAKFSAKSDGYPQFKAIDDRKEGETVMSALMKARGSRKLWQTQCHAAWSRDGSAIIFNRDAGDGRGSQLYFVDVDETVAKSGINS